MYQIAKTRSVRTRSGYWMGTQRRSDSGPVWIVAGAVVRPRCSPLPPRSPPRTSSMTSLGVSPSPPSGAGSPPPGPKSGGDAWPWEGSAGRHSSRCRCWPQAEGPKGSPFAIFSLRGARPCPGPSHPPFPRVQDGRRTYPQGGASIGVCWRWGGGISFPPFFSRHLGQAECDDPHGAVGDEGGCGDA